MPNARARSLLGTPVLRRLATAWANVLTVGLVTGLAAGCIPDKDDKPKWQNPPKAWDPDADNMSFGAKNLEAYAGLNEDDRQAHLEKLKTTAGSFHGQAHFQRATELGEKMDDVVLGKYEVFADLKPEETPGDKVFYEVSVDFHLFANEPIGQGLPPGTYIEFTGTLADLYFQDKDKPRKLEIKVKDVSITRLEDK